MVDGTVAPGTTRVDVAYDWGDQDPLLAQEPENQTVVDLGLWDADGLSGADSADRGFTPGAVEPGTWHVELGFGNVSCGGPPTRRSSPTRATSASTSSC